MDNKLVKLVLPFAGVAVALFLSYLAFSRPGYVTSLTYIGGLLFLEFLLVALWLYRRVFFAVLIVVFLLAGVDLPVGGAWTYLRWVVLAIAALGGCAIVLKEHRYSFGMFDVLAFLALLAALMSAAVSKYSSFSFFKVTSLVLLFVYAATGARVAVAGRESRFFTGLLLGCQIFVAVVGAFYFAGIEMMGNPNSLGAVMGVVAAPILLWGTLLKQSTWAHRSQLVLYGLAMYLTYASHARAAIGAGVLVSALLCVCLRRFRFMAQCMVLVTVIVAAVAILQPEVFSRSVSAFNNEVIYKGKGPEMGLLSSRKSPWQDTMDAIRDHYWFGTGFGTAETGTDRPDNVGLFSSSSATSKEHGSSYLEIVAWVGVVGSLPFLILLGSLLAGILRTMVWMIRSANPSHPAVPLAMVLLAGLLHAIFEDWLFAPGYYLCVFFWSLSFVFIDQTNRLPVVQRDQEPWAQSSSIVPQMRALFSGR